MKEALKSIFSGNCGELNKTTIKALLSRGLIDIEGRLSDYGRACAIELLPLKEQCLALGLELNNLNWNKKGKPEAFAAEYFTSQGYTVCACEGYCLGNIIKALCLETLTKSSIFYGTNICPREDVCLRDVSAFSYLDEPTLDKIYNEIITTNKTKFLSALSEILSYGMVVASCDKLDLGFAEKVFDSLSKESFVKIVKWLSMEHERRNGWPDLTLMKDGYLSMVEVKTTDKLHRSQIATIPFLKNIVGIEVFVVRLCKITSPK